jgi:ABC-2 type transport system permease protein
MRRVLTIAWKDLRSIYRQPSALATMLAAPLGVALILGLAFGGQGSFQLQPVTTVVADLSAAAAGTNGADGADGADGAGAADGVQRSSAVLVDVLTGKELDDLIDATKVKTAAAARRAVDDGEAAVAVIIPAGFDEAVGGAGGAQTQVEVYTDPTQQIGPGVVEGVVRQVVVEIDGARAAATASARLGMLATIGTAGDIEKIKAAAEDAARRFVAAGGDEGVVIEARAPSLPGSASSNDPGITGIVLAGQLVLFTFFGASIAARTILVEQEEGTLARLFTTPATRGSVLGGKFLLAYLTVLVQSIVILLVGWLAFQIDWGSFAPVAVLVLTGCAVACGLAMLIGAFSRTLAQEGAIGSGIFLVLALMGGNFTGSFAAGGAASTVSRLVPNGWLLAAWDTAMRGGTVADIALNVLVALAFAAVFFVVAAVVLRRRFA